MSFVYERNYKTRVQLHFSSSVLCSFIKPFECVVCPIRKWEGKIGRIKDRLRKERNSQKMDYRNRKPFGELLYI